MNADGFEHLEKELAKLRPASVPPEALERLAQISLAPMPFPDRLLAAWTAAGMLAACVVAALTIWQLTTAPTSQPATPQEMAQRQQIILENQKLIASR